MTPRAGGAELSTAALVGLAWPTAMRMLMLHGIVVADAWLVAPLGEAALAAMGLASIFSALLLGALAAFANASQVLVAQVWGSRDHAALRSAFRNSILISLGVGLLGLFGLIGVMGPVLAMSGQPAPIQTAARSYVLIFTGVILAEAVAQSLSAFLNGIGNARTPLMSYVISVPANIALSYAFIHGAGGLPALGLAGAAIGSVLGAVLRMAWLIWCVQSVRADWRDASPLPFAPALRAHVAFSLPIAATFFSAQAANSACMAIYAQLDTVRFAALTLILPWINVIGTLGMAWAQSTGILMAQHFGAGGGKAAMMAFLRTAWKGMALLSTAVATIYAGLIAATPWLYPALSPETHAVVASFLPVLLLLPWPKNSNAICGNTLRAAGRTIYVMHIFIWSQWAFRVPISALLVLWLDQPVHWILAMLLAEELVKFPLFHLGLLQGTWRRRLPD